MEENVCQCEFSYPCCDMQRLVQLTCPVDVSCLKVDMDVREALASAPKQR